MSTTEEEEKNDAIDPLYQQTELLFYALYNPEAPLLTKSKGQIAISKYSNKKTNSPSKSPSKSNSQNLEYNSPLSNYTIREDLLNVDEEKRKKLIDKVYSNLEEFDDDVIAPTYYPVKIANTQQYSPKSPKNNNDKKSVTSSSVSKADKLKLEMAIDIIQRKKEKQQLEKEKEKEFQKLKEGQKEYYLQEKAKYEKWAQELHEDKKKKRQKEREAQEKEREQHQKRKDQIEKVKKDYQDQLDKYKKKHPFSGDEPARINKQPFY